MSKDKFYEDLFAVSFSLIDGEDDAIANMSNISSLVYHALNELIPNSANWVGFYITRKKDLLILGPFHGKPACLRIPFGKGVCGTSAEKKESVVVPDVHHFPGHIACDSASRSEVVIPLKNKSGNILGVYDLD
eukprot:TRINITY_DN7960_c0_g1_i1.p1 TRINITY_DN7960_c0_g1~~TRINITY_DN7960_c0_g1_i1.p1  ORF type:complete len:133 (-),score=27.54 TRINITY_DN7960_c0_g1_i1:112-510(-)